MADDEQADALIGVTIVPTSNPHNDNYSMQKTSIRNFNSGTVAQSETEMWRAYYNHNFIKLLLVLRRLMHEFMGFSFIRSLQASYYAATAAASFRLNRGKESGGDVIVKKLEKLYKLVRLESGESFDEKLVAKAELEWWLIDRYPNRYNVTRRDALAKAASLLYGTAPEKLSKYSDLRASAMELQDKAEEVGEEADWREVEILLKEAYTSLRKEI